MADASDLIERRSRTAAVIASLALLTLAITYLLLVELPAGRAVAPAATTPSATPVQAAARIGAAETALNARLQSIRAASTTPPTQARAQAGMRRIEAALSRLAAQRRALSAPATRLTQATPTTAAQPSPARVDSRLPSLPAPWLAAAGLFLAALAFLRRRGPMAMWPSRALDLSFWFARLPWQGSASPWPSQLAFGIALGLLTTLAVWAVLIGRTLPLPVSPQASGDTLLHLALAVGTFALGLALVLLPPGWLTIRPAADVPPAAGRRAVVIGASLLGGAFLITPVAALWGIPLNPRTGQTRDGRACARLDRQPRTTLAVSHPPLSFVRNPRSGKVHFVTAERRIRDLAAPAPGTRVRPPRLEPVAAPTAATLAALNPANRVASIEAWATGQASASALAVLVAYTEGLSAPAEHRLLTLAAKLAVRLRDTPALTRIIARARALNLSGRAARWQSALERLRTGAEPANRRHRNWARAAADPAHAARRPTSVRAAASCSPT